MVLVKTGSMLGCPLHKHMHMTVIYVYSYSREIRSTCLIYYTMSAKQTERSKSLHSAVIGRKTTAILKGINRRKSEDSVTGELVSEVTSEKIACTVTRKDVHICNICYKPTTLGKHKLHIKVDGEPVKGSPFPVTVSSPTEHTFSTPLKFTEGVRGAWGVAIDQIKGDMIVVETKEHRVSIFGSNGDKLKSFGGRLEHGHHHRHILKSPRGVAIDSDGSFLVTDWEKHCIHKFTSEGEYVISLGREGNKPLEFKNPAGIGIHPRTHKIFVAEYGNHCVQILNPDFTFSNSFGCHGGGNGQFNHPYDVAFDSKGNVYVTDYDNHRIQVFTAEGQFLRHIGQWGTGNGDLQCPYSVTVSEKDEVYVTEGGNYRVSKFKTDGQFLELFGVEKRRLYMNALCGIAVTKRGGTDSGVLCLTDYINDCLLFFDTDFSSHEQNSS